MQEMITLKNGTRLIRPLLDFKKIDLIFLSLPNGEAQKFIKNNYNKKKNLKFIDLSADFRIKNTKIYEKVYNKKHKAKNLQNK